LSVSFENCSNGAASSIPQFDVNQVFDDGLARQIVGFYDTLRVAGPVMILAPILGAVGVDTRDGIAPDPIAMGCELVPAYIAADPAGQATLAATADTFASVALVTNAASDFLGWGVLVALYTVAILITRAPPRWISWPGLLVGVLPGWLGRLSPASSVVAGSPRSGSSASLCSCRAWASRCSGAAQKSTKQSGIITRTDLIKPYGHPLELADWVRSLLVYCARIPVLEAGIVLQHGTRKLWPLQC